MSQWTVRGIVVWLGLMAITGLCLVGSDARAYPEPAIVSMNWEFDVKIGKPGFIKFKRPGQIDPKLYLYVPYTVINNTPEERLFVPGITMATDAGDLIDAGRGVSTSIYDELRKHLRNDLLEDPAQVVDRLLVGDDHARDSVAVWVMPTHDIDEIRIFFGGLSGETQEVAHPISGDRILLRKTLMLDYDTPGNPRNVARKKINLRDTTWVMR